MRGSGLRHKDVMLEAVHDSKPELYPFVHQAYSAPSVLKFGHLLLSSPMGPQQGIRWGRCCSACPCSRYSIRSSPILG